MNLMSFNIRYGSANDGENKWENRKNILFNLIEKYNPDIIGLQEVEHFQLNEILERFPFYNKIGISRDGNTYSGELNPILFKPEYYSTTSDTFWLSATPHEPASRTYGNRLPRICTWGEFVFKDSDEKFYVLNTHLDHESKNARIEASKQLVEFTLNKDKVIIMGDFNCESEKSDEIKAILSNDFKDTYRIVHPQEKNSGTFHYFSGKPIATKIDFIFTRGFNVENASIIKDNENGRYPSDHFAITAKVNK